METFGNCTFPTDDLPLLLGAIIAARDTINASTALLAPSLHFKIAFSAIRAVTLTVTGAVYTKKTLTEIQGAEITYICAGFAVSALCAPSQCFKIALVTVGAMRASIYSAFRADSVTYLIV